MIAERALGRPLPVDAVVHHHSDTQLVICPSQTYHMELHRRMRVLAAGGDPNTQWLCRTCKKPTLRSELIGNPEVRERTRDCRSCNRQNVLVYQKANKAKVNARHRRLRAEKKAEEVQP